MMVSKRKRDTSLDSKPSKVPKLEEQQKKKPDITDYLKELTISFSLSSNPSTIVGREEERGKIHNYVEECITKRKSGSIYISGEPGTGKSATIQSLIKEFSASSSKVSTTYINCMEFTSQKDVFARISKDLKVGATDSQSIKEFLCYPDKKKMTLIVLDEIDQLLLSNPKTKSKIETVLYELFDWTIAERSTLILIGIANMKSITEQQLPLLARKNCYPLRVDFSTYNASQIEEIIKIKIKESLERLEEKSGKSEDESDQTKLQFNVFDPSAINCIAKSVAQKSGDIRKALDICKRAVFEMEVKINDAEDKDQAAVASKVNMAKALQILTSVFGQQSSNDGLSSLTNPQKILLCAAVRMFRSKKKATYGDLRDYYVSSCKIVSIPALSESEFSDLVDGIDCHEFLKIKPGKVQKTRKVELQISEDHIINSFESTPVLKRLLQ